LALEVGSIEVHEFLAAHRFPVIKYIRLTYVCLATIALWSGDTTIDKNPDESPRRLSSKIYKVQLHAVASSKNCSERCVYG
jgi:hypothetical protein